MMMILSYGWAGKINRRKKNHNHHHVWWSWLWQLLLSSSSSFLIFKFFACGHYFFLFMFEENVHACMWFIFFIPQFFFHITRLFPERLISFHDNDGNFFFIFFIFVFECKPHYTQHKDNLWIKKNLWFTPTPIHHTVYGRLFIVPEISWF